MNKLHITIALALMIGSVLAYDYDMSKVTGSDIPDYTALAQGLALQKGGSINLGRNTEIAMIDYGGLKPEDVKYGDPKEYATQTIGYNYDKDNDIYTVFFNVYVNGVGISTNSIDVGGTEPFYLVQQRIQEEAWNQYVTNEGSFEQALQDYISYNYENRRELVCKE